MTPTTPLEHLLPSLPAGHGWIPVGMGESGDRVYRRDDGAAYAKLAPADRAGLLEGERRRAEWLGARGLGAPAVLDWLQSPAGACLVTAALPGVPAADLPADALARAWPSLAGALKALHDLPVADCPFARRLPAMFDRARDVVGRGAVNPDFLAPEHQDVPPATLLAMLEAELAQRLAQEEGDLVVCHGDACLPNLMVDPGTLRCTGFVDLGRLGVADRHVDLALLLANARESWTSPGQEAAAFARLFEIHGIAAPDRGRLAFYLHLDPLTWG